MDVRVVDVVVVPTRAGALVADPGVEHGPAEMSWDEAAAWIANRQRVAGEDGVRWVWPDTGSVYARLLAAGTRVGRCVDLRLCHAILRFATPKPWTAPPWLAPAPVEAPAPTLLDDLTPDTTPTVEEVRAEHDRQQAAVAAADDPGRLRLLLAAESAGALIAAEMRADGLPWDRARHDAILTAELGPRPPRGMRPERLEQLAVEIRELLHSPGLNPDSQVTLLRALRHAGLDITSTAKWELTGQAHPVVAPLLEYKRLARLLSANGWSWLDTWVEPGTLGRSDRFRTDYVPGGVVTGRWATSGGGALQIPKAVRAAVVADPGWRLVVADAAQVEPRALAGMAGDLALARAGQDGDLYAGLVASGVVETRDRAKVGMLSALYGGTAGEAGVLLPRLRRAYPLATGLVDRAAQVGERGGTVRSWLGRTSPPPGPAWHSVQGRAGETDADQGDERRARAQARDRGRFTRNFVVQGTAAEWALCWMAETRRRLRALTPLADDPGAARGRSATATSGAGTAPGQGRPHLVFFLHDEIVVHTPEPLAAQVAEIVQDSASTAGRLLFGGFPLSFPLHVATVQTYAEADKT
ncbi:bifunctional 3'-5' exonuclease/DNA polymerase [Ornithinimicrobium sp. F0845]|uniref:bifunctional 3'-5' exonuclease/DNA polymerase n=1 Tax=Ornithinimicrobium sp. F0845 TaxID=2926412 RepID=UPI001FF29B62|nr:bifunctional 3'-5' exonuclease/DNA polymerase [Ornithinimicrobium sp. F0845]